jgi:hypothetical protein
VMRALMRLVGLFARFGAAAIRRFGAIGHMRFLVEKR